MPKVKTTHGGNRPGAGKPLKDPEKGKRIKTSITLTKEHFDLTAGDRSGKINEALNVFFSNEIHGPHGVIEQTQFQMKKAQSLSNP